MTQSLHNLSIAKKLGSFILCAVIGVVVLTAIFLASERTLLLEERQAAVRQTVEVAHGLLKYYNKMETDGALTRQQAQQQAMQALAGLRYSGQEYFWVNDLQPNMLMHPFNRKLEGTNLTNYQDPTGKRIFVEFVNTVKAQGAGYVFYMWPKPGNDQPVQKVSYVSGFSPWGWVVGSGVYIDNIETLFLSRLIQSSIGALLIAGLLVAIGLLITRSLTRQLGGEPRYAVQIAEKIAQGDLAITINTKTQDTSSVLFAMKKMRDNLAEIVSDVRSGTESIFVASNQIAAGNLDLSSRTEEQSSSLTQTASAMEQLTSTVRQTTDNARQAHQLASSASTEAKKGGVVVSDVVSTMASINESSHKMADIVSTIDSIAFQTNILALNAAVEAARAGEEGRGFAVVAAEVRTLAQRSAAAAREIKTLIDDSVSRIDTGSQLVDRAGTTMHDIVGSVQSVNDIIGEITAASLEQSTGIEQVNQAIIQMEQVTQQNAALVSESAAAADALKTQAKSLAELVSTFKLHASASRWSD